MYTSTHFFFCTTPCFNTTVFASHRPPLGDRVFELGNDGGGVGAL